MEYKSKYTGEEVEERLEKTDNLETNLTNLEEDFSRSTCIWEITDSSGIISSSRYEGIKSANLIIIVFNNNYYIVNRKEISPAGVITIISTFTINPSRDSSSLALNYNLQIVITKDEETGITYVVTRSVREIVSPAELCRVGGETLIGNPGENIEVGEDNIQSNWEESDLNSDSYIKNKTHGFIPTSIITTQGEYIISSKANAFRFKGVISKFPKPSQVTMVGTELLIRYYQNYIIIEGSVDSEHPVEVGNLTPLSDIYIPETVARTTSKLPNPHYLTLKINGGATTDNGTTTKYNGDTSKIIELYSPTTQGEKGQFLVWGDIPEWKSFKDLNNINIPWSFITNSPTTVGDYGITDVYDKDTIDGKFDDIKFTFRTLYNNNEDLEFGTIRNIAKDAVPDTLPNPNVLFVRLGSKNTSFSYDGTEYRELLLDEFVDSEIEKELEEYDKQFADVATSGKYSDLLNAPKALPNPNTLTIYVNGKSTTYNGNEKTTVTLNIPTETSLTEAGFIKSDAIPTELPNPHALGIITDGTKRSYKGTSPVDIEIPTERKIKEEWEFVQNSDLNNVAFSGDYGDLKNAPTEIATAMPKIVLETLNGSLTEPIVGLNPNICYEYIQRGLDEKQNKWVTYPLYIPRLIDLDLSVNNSWTVRAAFNNENYLSSIVRFQSGFGDVIWENGVEPTVEGKAVIEIKFNITYNRHIIGSWKVFKHKKFSYPEFSDV